MQQILEEYKDVFQAPSCVPPICEVDHCTPLKEGTKLVNVHPYHYAYFQTKEIEKQVQEILNSRLIRLSISPFSSLVFDEFCTNYCALNDITIKDRFPIPMVDDMLDELYGASYFTRLDLEVGYHQVRVNSPNIPKTLLSILIMVIMNILKCLLACVMHLLHSRPS